MSTKICAQNRGGKKKLKKKKLKKNSFPNSDMNIILYFQIALAFLFPKKGSKSQAQGTMQTYTE